MKPAILRQTTGEADALWHRWEICNFKTFKLEREEKNNPRGEFGSKNNKVLGYNLFYLWPERAPGPPTKTS